MPPAPDQRILDLVRQYWGFSELRPLQAEAIQAGTEQRDALIVMPTGGGKSLCYQVPPLVTGRTDVVVSPLISLMKDQVDALRACGYPAEGLHSGLDDRGRREAENRLAAGELRLLFVAPERLLNDGFLAMLKRADVRSFAVDEAHCISQWGHDFRPEYRQLATLRQHFPHASLHAFTATATPAVRRDIVRQLEMRDPLELVGHFDRPNLVYRILPQVDVQAQTLEVVRRHAGESVIVYCLSRNDTEALAAVLCANGIEAQAYHAGLDAGQRRRTQEAFASERLDVVVATVAFGMGIDRSNVRCVLHATMPKTIENYQQETGRAGRDGLEAECVLLYSAADAIRWRSLMQAKAGQYVESTEDTIGQQEQLLRRMQGLCSGVVCRHKSLSEYFGQSYENENCGACDVCLDEVEDLEDATVTAQKILSCVARTGQRFGAGHVVDVLGGANTEQVRRLGHEQLSTYGLLQQMAKKQLMSLVYQLVDQGVIERSPGDRPTLYLNDASVEVMRGQRAVRLLRPRQKAGSRTRIEQDAWEGVDRGLFDHLREMRRTWARERDVPPYVIFEDGTLRDLSRWRPTTLVALRGVRGIGDKRATEWGKLLVDAIGAFCTANDLETDLSPQETMRRPTSKRLNPQREKAFDMFARSHSIQEVAEATERAVSTTTGYLAEWIEKQGPVTIDPWVDPTTYHRVVSALGDTENARLRPIFDRLEGEVPFETIRLVLAHLRARSADGRQPEDAEAPGQVS